MTLHSVKLAFLIICIVMNIVLCFFLAEIYPRKGRLDKLFKGIIITAVFAASFYAVFQISEDYRICFVSNTVFFMLMDYLTLEMFVYALLISDRTKYIKVLKIILFIILLLDHTSLIINLWTKHSYTLESARAFDGSSYYYPLLKPFHWTHLAFCYIMVLGSVVNLLISAVTVPSVYKKKFITIMIFYSIVIAIDFVCFSLELPINFSIPMYGLLGAFVCYYTIFTFPAAMTLLALRNVNETIQDGVVFYSKDGKCLYANKAAKKIFLEGKYFSEEIAEEYLERYLSETGRLPSESEKREENFMIDGKIRSYECEYQTLYENKRKLGSFFKLTDKTDEITQLNKEKHISTHDDLTGLLNRVGFFEEVNKKLKTINVENYVMVTSDIKDFKLINEIFGEKTGDNVLRRQSSLLRNMSHDDNIYARIGEDNFAIFMKKAYLIESVFIKAMEDMKRLTENGAFRMHIRVGIYEPPAGSAEDAQTIYDKAVMAINSLPNDYTHVFARYDATIMDKLLAEKNILCEFEKALEKKEFSMEYLPQMNSDGKLIGAEVLPVWNSPVLGKINYENFIPVLEKTGLIHKMNFFIWNETASQLKKWQDKGLKNVPLSVHISDKDFYYSDVRESLNSIMKENCVSNSLFKLEISENVLMSNLKKKIEIFENLYQDGFVLEIDNFGTEYSSLNMLKDIQAKILKMDIKLLKENEENERSKKIMAAVLCMAKAIDITVIVKNLENSNQYKILTEMGCTAFQGPYYSLQISADEFEEKFLRKNS